MAAITHTVGAPPAFAETPNNDHVATLLSPSQVRCMIDCPARWYFKYHRRMPEKRNSKLALGSAVHAAVATNYEQKVETKRDLAAEGLVGVFRMAWAIESQGIDFAAEEENPAELQELGEVMVRKYMDEAAPLVQPAAVELEVAGEIGGVPVQGIIDVLDVHGTVIDVKTSSKSPSGLHNDTVFQVATYSLLEPRARGTARIDTLTKTKTVKLVPQTFEVSEDDRRYAKTMYPLAQETMRAGLYMPNRGSNLCSQSNCSYWQECQAEYGGRVRE